MLTFSRFVTLILIILLLSCSAQEDRSAPLSLTYIANTGFLLEAGDDKVLVDAIFSDKTIDYCDLPPDSVLLKMEMAHDPFDDIDLVLVTHYHRDHFDPVKVAKHLKRNPGAILVCPEQANQKMQEDCGDYSDFVNQVKPVSLALGSVAEMTVNDIHVKALRLKHTPYMEEDPRTGESRDRHEHVENLVYLFEMNGNRIVHVGDTSIGQNEEHLGLLFDDDGIDVAFVSLHDWTETSMQLFENVVRPDYVVFDHLPLDAKDLVNTITSFQPGFAEMLAFDEPMESRTFHDEEQAE